MARIVIVGCGAAGSVSAALMADAGHDVFGITLWPDHAAAMTANGLRVEGASCEQTIRLHATTTTELPFAQRTRMDETGMVGVAGMEIGSVLVRASPSLSLIGGPSSTRYCRHGRTPADCGRRPSWSTLGRFPDARASRRPLPEGGDRENIASALCRSRRAQAGRGGLPAACHPGSGSARGAPVPDDDARIAGACRVARGGPVHDRGHGGDRCLLKPVWHILEGRFELVLANAAHIKGVP